MGYDCQVIVSPDEDPHIGKGYAIKQGLELVTGEYVLVMDADMQVNPKAIKSFFKLMELYDADAVIGNKHHCYSTLHYTFTRKIVSAGYRLLVKVLFDFPLRDTQCGFKLFKRGAIESISTIILENRFTLDLEMLIALRENDFVVIDAPVCVREQENEGSVNLKTILETFVDTLKVWVRRQRGWYKLI